MSKKYLITVYIFTLFLSGCVATQDKSASTDPINVSVSGDAAVSVVDRKGF